MIEGKIRNIVSENGNSIIILKGFETKGLSKKINIFHLILIITIKLI